MKTRILWAAALLLLPVSAHAQDGSGNGLNFPPPGTTILNLSATETQKVPQDLIIASLRIEVDSNSAADVQKQINTAMQEALALAKKEPDVKAVTGAYSVYPYDPNPQPIPQHQQNEPRPMRWRGSQSLDLKSLKPDPVLDLSGKLQEKGFAMNNLGYTLSPEKYESVQDGLLVTALAKLQAKAELAAKSLDKKKVEMLDVNLSPSGPVYPMYARAEMQTMGAAMDKAMPTPVVEAGESDVSLSVSARVLLRP